MTLISASAVHAQQAVRLGASIGYGGGGPAAVIMKGASGELVLGRSVALVAEAMTLSHGNGPCAHRIPSPCDGSAVAGAVGLLTTFNTDTRKIHPFAALEAGTHDFSGIAVGERVYVKSGRRPMAVGVIGLRVPVVAGFGAGLLLHKFYVFDDEDYVAALDKNLRYTTLSLGLSYSWQ